MATIQEIKDYAIEHPEIPLTTVRGMLAKAEDLHPQTPLQKANYHETPITDAEKTPGFTDTFLPTKLLKSAGSIGSNLLSSEGRSDLLDTGGQALIDGVKQNIKDLPLQPYKSLYDLGMGNINSIGEPLGRWSGGDKSAPVALLGSAANFALPFAGERLGAAAGASVRGLGQGFMDTRATTGAGMARSGIVGGAKGLLKGLVEGPELKTKGLLSNLYEQQAEVPKINPVSDTAPEIPDYIRKITEQMQNEKDNYHGDFITSQPQKLPQISNPVNPAPDVLDNALNQMREDNAPWERPVTNNPYVENPIASRYQDVREGSQPIDSIKRIAPKANQLPNTNLGITPIGQKFGNILKGNDDVKALFSHLKEPEMTNEEDIPQEIAPKVGKKAIIDNTLKSVSEPTFDSPAQRGLDQAMRMLKVATDPKEITGLNARIEKFKGMINRLKAHNDMEIF